MFQVDAIAEFPELFRCAVAHLLAAAGTLTSGERRVRYAACSALDTLEQLYPGLLGPTGVGPTFAWMQQDRSYARQSTTLLLLTLLEVWYARGARAVTEGCGTPEGHRLRRRAVVCQRGTGCDGGVWEAASVPLG